MADAPQPHAASDNLAVPEKTQDQISKTSSNEALPISDHSSRQDSIILTKEATNASHRSASREQDLRQLDSLDRINTADFPTKSKLAFIVLALVLSIFLVSLDMTIVATAIPRITDEFNSLQDVGWYGAAFFLTVGAFQSTWGKGYKFYDLKKTYLVSIGIFEVGSLICGVAQNSITLIVGRAIQGELNSARIGITQEGPY